VHWLSLKSGREILEFQGLVSFLNELSEFNSLSFITFLYSDFQEHSAEQYAKENAVDSTHLALIPTIMC